MTRFGTDQIWNMYRDPEIVKTYLHKYMVDDWESISSMGEYIRGYEKLEHLTLTTMTAFPDIKLHIVDTFCEGLGTYAVYNPFFEKKSLVCPKAELNCPSPGEESFLFRLF